MFSQILWIALEALISCTKFEPFCYSIENSAGHNYLEGAVIHLWDGEANESSLPV